MTDKEYQLTDADKARIERNRQHALLRRQQRMASHPYLNKNDVVSRVTDSKLIDSGGGFFVEESEIKEPNQIEITQEPAPSIPHEQHYCTECKKSFYDSFMLQHFDFLVCNDCRDEEDKHRLITKTDAKNEFLLKDVDLEKREPLLKFILRKNPYNSNWGSMKLFLRSQVYERALEVWGSEEDIEEEKDRRKDKKEKMSQKKFNKKIKELRMAVRSSTYTKDLSGHEHSYEEETYDEKLDMYSKTCVECGQTVSYEKM